MYFNALYSIMLIMLTLTGSVVTVFPHVSPMGVALAWTAGCAIALWLIGLAAIFGWQWRRVVVQDEKVIERNVWSPESEPYVDFQHGIMMKFSNPKNGEVAEVVLNPAWIHLLPGNSTSTINQRPNECLIPGRSFAKVKAGTEPASLVAIKSCGDVVGYGSRVKFEGKDYLLTAHHVWHRSPKPDALAKTGKQVDIGEWEEKYSCDAAVLDFSLVAVPALVWAKLGVKASRVAPLSTSESVSAYGGTNTMEIMAGFGKATPTEGCKWKLVHDSPTIAGWSGTPLYSTRGVVGMHLGVEQFGKANRAVNIGWVLTCLLRSDETMPPELGMLEIDYDDVELRSAHFEEVLIKGKGSVALGPREFAWKPKSGETWYEMDDDELDYEDENTLRARLGLKPNETTQHLNCQRAAGRNALPPSLNLRGMNSTPSESSEVKACLSGKSGDRIANLEKSLENLHLKMSQMLNESFQSSKILVGLNEVPLPSSNLSFTKQLATGEVKDREILKQPAKSCSESTPRVDPSSVSAPTTGPSTKSMSRQRRRRNRRKSTGTPAPEFPSRN